MHKSKTFEDAVHAFLKVSDTLKTSKLYEYDAIELGAQLIGLKIDELLIQAEKEFNKKTKYKTYQKAIDLMLKLDKILASHPLHKLENWVTLARKFGDTEQEKLYYESNAKRLITTWGGGVNEYAARTWSGLIGDYYAQRWQLWLNAQKENKEFDVLKWEENWIQSEWKNKSVPYKNPILEIKEVN